MSSMSNVDHTLIMYGLWVYFWCVFEQRAIDNEYPFLIMEAKSKLILQPTVHFHFHLEINRLTPSTFKNTDPIPKKGQGHYQFNMVPSP